jgi:invasion protein IalB
MRFPIALSLFISTLAFVATGPAAALELPSTSRLQSSHDSWSVYCDKPAGASVEQCVLLQYVIDDAQPDLGMAVTVLKSADRKARFLRIQVPLGVLLPKGLDLYIDKNRIGTMYYLRCLSDGCYAQVVLTDDMMKVIRAGKEMQLGVYKTDDPSATETGIAVPVDLKGFAEGYDALP